jgi:hypothetical protein
MVNNRTFYAVKQLSVKNTSYVNNTGRLLDRVWVTASGTTSSTETLIPINPDGSGELLPGSGQLITPSGEVISYTATSGSPVEAVNGITRGFISTAPTAITSGDLLKFHHWEVLHGVQSVGVTTNYGLEQVFEWGQLEIYENIENIPDVEVTVERVLDGTKPMWFMVTDETQDELNASISAYQSDVGITIYPDSQSRASGTAQQFMMMSGMFISNATYTFPVDGNFTESITLVGNDKTWLQSDAEPEGFFIGAGAEDATVIGSGVQRRENFNLTSSELPTDIPGVPGAGVGNAGSGVDEHLQTVTLSVDIGREEVFELGRKKPFLRTVTFPIEVSATIEVVTAEGDRVEASSDVDSNLTNQNLLVKTDSGLQIDLGGENKLLSIDFGGGDAGGGNDNVTYTYQTFNVFTVTHDNTDYTRKVGI